MSRRLDRAPLIAAAVALLVYLPSIGGAFLYDDARTVLDNRSIRPPVSIVTVLQWDRTRPLLNLTLALNYAISGLDPWSYHLVNVLVHVGNAALLASLFLWIAARSGTPHGRRAALVGACLFGASPMAAETVAYVSSRSTALATLFGLASLRLGVDGLERRTPPRLAASLLFFVLALAAKEEAASVPLLLLILDFFFVAGQKGSEIARRWRTYAFYLALPVLGLLGRRLATGAWLPPPHMDRLRYALIEWAAFPVYLLRQLLPVDPALYRGHVLSHPLGLATLLWGLVTLAVAVAAVAGRRRWPDWSFAVAWLAAGLLPSSSFVPLGEAVVDHRAYLGGAGIAFCVGGLLSRLRWRWVSTAVVALLGARSVQYERVLADPVRAWEDVCRRVPDSALALRSLAEAYAGRGDPRAEAAFLRALEVDPKDEVTWTNVGVYYGTKGRLDDAERALRRALALASRQTEGLIHDDLGQVLESLGREDEAMIQFEKAFAADPRLAQPRISLAQILIRRGDAARAGALLDEAAKVEMTPEEAEWIERLRHPAGAPHEAPKP